MKINVLLLSNNSSESDFMDETALFSSTFPSALAYPFVVSIYNVLHDNVSISFFMMMTSPLSVMMFFVPSYFPIFDCILYVFLCESVILPST